MVSRFAKAYRAAFPTLHRKTNRTDAALARQIPVNGYGIADFVAVTWEPGIIGPADGALNAAIFLAQAKPVIRAFELKLRDWRKALKQAHRYRYFAHVAIVVLPPGPCATALKYLETFKLLEVGLWSYDAGTDRIVTHFTPRPLQPFDAPHQLDALRLVAKASKALPIA